MQPEKCRYVEHKKTKRLHMSAEVQQDDAEETSEEVAVTAAKRSLIQSGKKRQRRDGSNTLLWLLSCMACHCRGWKIVPRNLGFNTVFKRSFKNVKI